ncbi:MAG: DUF58 domain-containing protein [Deltaproteobacteria bacterium]|nr:DUF58 domain-containing protein [Deltaproteobacteria bacterium]
MIPSRRFVLLVALGIVPALFGMAWQGMAVVAAIWDVSLVVLLGVDLFLRPRPEALEIRRQVEDILSLARPTEVQLRLRWHGRRTLRLALVDAPPERMEVSGARQRFDLPAGGVVDTHYRLRPLQRGEGSFGDLHLRLRGPLGLCWILHQRRAPQRVKVYPDLATLTDGLDALIRRPDAGDLRARRRPTEGREFDSLRDYVPGDDIRRIDWKATARRGLPITRQYRPDQHQDIILMLDCGRQMRPRVGNHRKLDHAVNAALSLAHVALEQRDKVGLIVFHHEVVGFVPPHGGREQRMRLTEQLFHVEPTLTESSYPAAFDALARLTHRRALLVLFTDLPDEASARPLLDRLSLLRGRHLPLVVCQRDTELEQAATSVPRSEREAYRRVAAGKLSREREGLRHHLLSGGAQVIEAPAPELTLCTVERYLQIKGRGML